MGRPLPRRKTPLTPEEAKIARIRAKWKAEGRVYVREHTVKAYTRPWPQKIERAAIELRDMARRIKAASP